MPTFADLQARVRILLQDAVTKLATADRDKLIEQAIQERYSKDRARELVADVAGNGTSDLTLPATHEDGFSVIRQIEYPIGNVPPTLIESADWQLYRTPTGLKLRLLANTPAATENIRLTYTGRHLADGTTVLDFEAVCEYAAALGFEALAAIYAQTGDSTLGADAVNYRSKSQEYRDLAKAHRKRYFDYMGIEESAGGAAQTGAALVMGEMDNQLGAGVDRLTHPKGTR
jgi:hypothetical protein